MTPRLLFLSMLAIGGCGAADVYPQPNQNEEATARLTPDSTATVHLTRRLWVLNEAGGACQTTVSGFFQCMLGHTNWNSIAVGYPAGENLQWGGMATTNGAPCGRYDYQCAQNVAHWPLADYDVLLIIYPSGTGNVGGQNGMATIDGKPVNTAFVWSSGNNCGLQTIYGGHEVFEAQTDGVSADCCDGEVPGNAGASCLNWCDQCGAVCAKFGPTSCSYGGVSGGGSYGISTVSCGGVTYSYQKVSPANGEFNGTCLAIAAAAPVKPPIPPAPTGCGAITAGHGLGPGVSARSCDGRFALVMQTDGNLVLYQGSQPMWATGTNGAGYLTLMQSDGNLVEYAADGRPIWASHTNGHSGASLALQNDGNAVLYAAGKALWSSNTCCR